MLNESFANIIRNSNVQSIVYLAHENVYIMHIQGDARRSRVRLRRKNLAS